MYSADEHYSDDAADDLAGGPYTYIDDASMLLDEHLDGEHEDGIYVDCPTCRDDAAALNMSSVLPVLR